jgi:hypothetical protein
MATAMKTLFSFLTLIVAACGLIGCNRSSAPAGAAKPPADAVEQKLQDLAGKGATNCGRLQLNADVKSAGDCAMQASGAKKPFYVAYDMPGLTVGVAGAADGKLYSVQAQTAEGNQSAPPTQVTSTECPAALRLAQSGRVTCIAPGNMGGMGGGGTSPHGGMTMPPAGAENPHGGGMMMPPSGTPNPHKNSGIPTEGAKSH